MKKLYSIVVAFLMFFNLSLFAQDGPPWDFNGTDHGFEASNFTSLAIGDSYLTYSINSPNEDGNGGSSNPNLKISNVEIDTSPGIFFAVTMQNLTANTKVVVIINKNGNNTYTPFDGITPNDEGFVTHYINVGGSSNWNGTVNEVNFRFKQGGGVNNNVYSGDILIDHIEIVDAIPSTPRTDYTFDDPSDAEGFVGGNGVSLSQPNAGSIVANISANSPYPKFEQSGVYNVDADTYKYVEINLTNNSPKNRVTFVSPNGGNEFASSDMVAGEQLIYLNLSEMTNWNGTYSNWWLQLVESTDDGPTPSEGEVIIDRILFTDVNNAPIEDTNVTFSVNTENIEVGPNGIYVGGGVLGGSNAYALSDEDGDGVWTTTIGLAPGTTGNYIFFNSPNGDSDWGTKEQLNGQDCADPANFDDRILDPVGEEDYTLLHCFGECSGNGTGECPTPATTYDVTFSVDMSNYPGGLAEGDIVYISGSLNSWCGDCNPMDDSDGDGIWTTTIALENGDYEYKHTINNWAAQEEFGSAVEGCTVSDGTFTNRAFTVADADLTLETVFWNLCPGETPGQVYNVTFAVDTANITVGESGMFLGGGAFGNAQGNAMTDEDGDGVYEVTLELNTDQAGVNYVFLNGPGDGGDWGAKEDLAGQECADPDSFNDRILPEFDGDTYLLHCFGDCSGDGVGCSVAPDGMMVLQGIIDFDVPSAGSNGKALHVLVTEDIADLTNYGLGVANNGGGSDGEEYVFPEGSATAGQHILIARSIEAMEAYGMTGFDLVLEANSDISQNGDDAIELYFGGSVIEVFGELDVDGTGQPWEYTDSWAYKVDDAWTYGGVDCTDDSETTCESGCPYPFVECAEPVTFPLCEDFEDGAEGWTFVDAGGETTDWALGVASNDDGTNSTQGLFHGYDTTTPFNDWAVSPSYDTSGLAEGTATVSYSEICNWCADSEAHNVYYSLDYAGDATTATWVALFEGVNTAAEDAWVSSSYSIPSAESIVFAFNYVGTYGANWNVDDICIDGTLSASDNEILDMMVYPNPVDGNYVTIVTPVQGSKEIQVYTVTGRKVMDTVINGNTLDVSSFNSGFYMLKVTVDGQSKISKLVVR